MSADTSIQSDSVSMWSSDILEGPQGQVKFKHTRSMIQEKDQSCQGPNISTSEAFASPLSERKATYTMQTKHPAFVFNFFRNSEFCKPSPLSKKHQHSWLVQPFHYKQKSMYHPYLKHNTRLLLSCPCNMV